MASVVAEAGFGTSLLGGRSSASGDGAMVVAGEEPSSAGGEKEASRERLPMVGAVWEAGPGGKSLTLRSTCFVPCSRGLEYFV